VLGQQPGRVTVYRKPLDYTFTRAHWVHCGNDFQSPGKLGATERWQV
jgi:hypothetical protein